MLSAMKDRINREQLSDEYHLNDIKVIAMKWWNQTFVRCSSLLLICNKEFPFFHKSRYPKEVINIDNITRTSLDNTKAEKV